MHVTTHLRELLPHIFTLTPYGAVIFCGTCCSRNSETFLLGSMALCSAPTFLTEILRRDRITGFISKNTVK